MLGESETNQTDVLHSPVFRWGCGGILFLIFIILTYSIIQFTTQWGSELQYPGSAKLSNHRIYRYIPFRMREDFSFASSDNFHDVFEWYSLTFDLGSEAGASERCAVLHGDTPYYDLAIEMTINVTVCDLDPEIRVYVTRFISLP